MGTVLIQNDSVDARSIFVTGISKSATDEEIINHFNTVGIIETLKRHPINKCLIWITYSSKRSADTAISHFHRTRFKNVILSVKSQIRNIPGETNNNNNIEHIPTISLLPREIKLDYDPNNVASNIHLPATYSNDGIIMNNTLYPFPRGKYSDQLLAAALSNTFPHRGALQLIADPVFGRKHGKEISESMGILNGLRKLFEVNGIQYRDSSKFRFTCISVGDGVLPFTSIVLAAFLVPAEKSHFHFHSVDPLMNFDVTGCDLLSPAIKNSLHTHKCKSEDFQIPISVNSINSSNISGENIEHITVLISCHSHCDMNELWSRVSTPKLAVCLPCCGHSKAWSIVSNVEAMLEYEDYEIYSPKRKVYLYQDLIFSPNT